MTEQPAMNIEAILTGLLGSAHTPEKAEHAAREVLAMHAHQLAERQRKHWMPRPPGATADYVRGLDDGLDKAADLIDPKTEAQR